MQPIGQGAGRYAVTAIWISVLTGQRWKERVIDGWSERVIGERHNQGWSNVCTLVPLRGAESYLLIDGRAGGMIGQG
ncbi:hypothetical protein chiPu_0021749 [Chiloscyllium punctatum]|uniref:Uncharacterized protein n=1 Tax=Chiloscyllium punctatum TaxID=137246 RepID=A0A401RLL0_CHIPU|nr:hypothetical protein [Chiloscyllium punctatum]